ACVGDGGPRADGRDRARPGRAQGAGQPPASLRRSAAPSCPAPRQQGSGAARSRGGSPVEAPGTAELGSLSADALTVRKSPDVPLVTFAAAEKLGACC